MAPQPQAAYSSFAAIPVPPAPAYQPPRPQLRVLSNGVTVLLMPDAARPIVELELRLRAGSYDDPPGQTGAAQLTAELLREGGSAAWPGDRIDEELGFLGAELECSAREEYTVLELSCLKEDFPLLLEILAEVLLRPGFPEDKWRLTRSRALRDVAQRDDDPIQAANRESRRAFYGPSDPRVRRVERAELETLERADLAAFHREHYGSSGALLAVYGDFAAGEMERWLEDALGAWPAQARPQATLARAAPRPDQRRVYLADRADLAQAEVRILHAGLRRDHPDYAALRLASYVVGVGGMSNRMTRVIRSELGLAYHAGAYWTPSFDQEGLFLAFCGTKNESAARAIREMLRVLDELLNHGVSAEELEATKRRLLNAEIFDEDTPGKALERITDLQFYGYPWDYFERLSREVRAVTPEQLLAACRRHLDLERCTLFVLGAAPSFDAPLDEFGPVEPWEAGPPAAETP